MTIQNSTPRYIVMTSSAKMPGSVKSHYRNIAVVETDQEGEPKMISTHARHCVRVVKHYGPQHVGKTDRCAYNVALDDAQAYADQLNAKENLLPALRAWVALYDTNPATWPDDERDLLTAAHVVLNLPATQES